MSTSVLPLAQICKENALQLPGSDVVATLSSVEKRSISSAANLHTVLHSLATMVAQALPLPEVLHKIASLLTRALQIDLCVILLKDAEGTVFQLATSAPEFDARVELQQRLQLPLFLTEKLTQAMVQGELPQLCWQELKQLDPLKNVQYKTLLPIPLVVEPQCFGIVNCYAGEMRLFTQEEKAALALLAAQTALLLKNRQCLEEDVQTRKMLIKAFFADLLSSEAGMEDLLRRRASSLHVDLALPHVLVLVECIDSRHDGSDQHEGPLSQVARYISGRYTASLVDESPLSLCCLICLDADTTFERLQQWFTALVERLRAECQLYITVGLSNPCAALSGYRLARQEAQEALQVSAALSLQGTCCAFASLGAYRYLYQFARTETLPDAYQVQIETLVAYDQRKRTNLLDTLEAFLESGSNAARTASQLTVHRNTLLQRLERIQKICTLDLEQDRLPLLLALKVYRLRTHFAVVGAQ